MKTQILQLETHDDWISTRDKMGWGQTGRIVLVWPNRGRILTRRLDLVLLQRHSATLGAQLALVTTDRVVRAYAKELRIPVFATLKKAQGSRWRTFRRRPLVDWEEHNRPDLAALKEQARPTKTSWTEKPVARLGFFSLGVFSFLAIVAILFPGAQISITPRAETQEAVLAVTAGQNIPDVRLSGEIPARVESVIVEGAASLPTTGKAPAPEKFASGYVRFTNLTDQKVEIPLGTVVTSLPTDNRETIRFTTSDDGALPAEAGKTLSLPVRALAPGSQGNLPVGSLVAVEGQLGLKVSVTNTVSTSGGSDRSVAGPTDANYETLYAQLSKTLQEKTLGELQLSLAAGDMPITATVSLSQTLVKAYDPPQAETGLNPPGDVLELNLRQEYRVLVISGQDLQKLASQVLDARLLDGWQAIGAPTLTPLSAPAVGTDGTVRYRLTARREIRAQYQEAEIVRLALGRSPNQAATAIASAFPLAVPPRITMSPDWWPNLPFLPFRIAVLVK